MIFDDIANLFSPVVAVFNFIRSLLTTIINGISGLISIIRSVISLLLSITKILPYPLYPCLMAFLTLYSTIFIYKIFRKG